ASTIERITWKQVEYRQQKISGADEKEKCSPEIEVQRRGQNHPAERDQRKQKTRRRPSDRNAKFRFRILRLSFQTREAAEGMQDDLLNLNSFGASHQGVGEFMTKDRHKQSQRRDNTQGPRKHITGGWNSE